MRSLESTRFEHLSDARLERFHDGAPDPGAEEHLRLCLICSRRLQALREEQAAMESDQPISAADRALFQEAVRRWDAGRPTPAPTVAQPAAAARAPSRSHPSMQQLSQYGAGLAARGTATAAADFPAVQEHLQDCGACRAGLASLLQAAPSQPAEALRGEARAAGSVPPPWQLLFPPTPGLGVAEAHLDPNGALLGYGHESALPATGWRLHRAAEPRGSGYVVQARVTDEGGRPVAGATVELSLPGQSAQPRMAPTGRTGIATFEDVPVAALQTASVRVVRDDG